MSKFAHVRIAQWWIISLSYLFLFGAHGQPTVSEKEIFTRRLALGTDDPGATRFAAVHGRRSLIMGYPQNGLEVWAYPFQILSHYQVGFRPIGTTVEVDGRLLLRRIEYRPDSIIRTYIGPDYLVREKLFVPLDEAAAVISYEVEGSRRLDIEVHFTPSLNLMWPASLGGQYTRWNAETSGFVISEPSTKTSATVFSPETIRHDNIVNSTVSFGDSHSFSIRPKAIKSSLTASAIVFIVLDGADPKHPTVPVRALSERLPGLEAEAATHYAELAGKFLQIHTPNEEVNSALAWSAVALDQAWVCNARLGCGIVAGYGPSRDARRPQYEWFFAGDGLVATNALISGGQYSRAREELEFILKYQEPATGMIWHELSQSAGYIDWSKYPYMYVHVDISLDYLVTVARYVGTSGDIAFASDNWSSIAAAYHYCQTLIRSADHLPHIPADKEGGDEQARPGDDLSLSAGWLAATAAIAELATFTGHAQIAKEALDENQLARPAIAVHYWNSAQNFWVDGHTAAGLPIPGRRQGPTQLIASDVFSTWQNETLLDQLASSDFRSDWGMRELAMSSSDYDPYSYGRGSVTAPGSTNAAVAFWRMHRPDIAFGIWNSVVQWNSLDSLGHIHEVLAGSFYHEQTESVPEQTWSSAVLVDAAVRGLLGLDVDGIQNHIHFVPHIPIEWDRVSLENVRLPRSTLKLAINRGSGYIDLEIYNQGSASNILFEPQIPLGARLISAEFQGHLVDATTRSFSEDEHARLSLDVPAGASRCRIRFSGGVSLLLDHAALHVGDPSTAIKLTKLQLQGRVISIEADIHPAAKAAIQIQTPWKIVSSEGATARALADNKYELEIEQKPSGMPSSGYRHVRLSVKFSPD
jgi:glycogen debranching enzyme